MRVAVLHTIFFLFSELFKHLTLQNGIAWYSGSVVIRVICLYTLFKSQKAQIYWEFYCISLAFSKKKYSSFKIQKVFHFK